MLQLGTLSVVVTILACFLHAQGADKYTDENRPYEFGFNIDGEQHRHEKKDERGLIMGEFGFITADGVYHVTVYATDENGNFKILSMKNIRTRPYPTAPAKKGHSIPFPPSQQAPITQGPRQFNDKPIEPPVPVKSCSHCSIPSTKAPVLIDIAVVSRDNTVYPNPQNPDQKYPQTNYPNNIDYPNSQNPNQNYPQPPDVNQPNTPDYQSPENYPQPVQDGPQYPQPGETALQYPDPNAPSGERIPKQYFPKPTLVTALMSMVKPDTDIYHKGPGERDGLPDGLTKKDMKLLLYTFNYTVGFHGHHEEGYTDGTKQGYYFVTGRNGVRTRIDYVADENGFRPKITQEVLDLISEDVPKPETEKDAKYGLKGYEFKWLYYPVDSRKR